MPTGIGSHCRCSASSATLKCSTAPESIMVCQQHPHSHASPLAATDISSGPAHSLKTRHDAPTRPVLKGSMSSAAASLEATCAPLGMVPSGTLSRLGMRRAADRERCCADRVRPLRLGRMAPTSLPVAERSCSSCRAAAWLEICCSSACLCLDSACVEHVISQQKILQAGVSAHAAGEQARALCLPTRRHQKASEGSVLSDQKPG